MVFNKYYMKIQKIFNFLIWVKFYAPSVTDRHGSFTVKILSILYFFFTSFCKSFILIYIFNKLFYI